MGVESWKKLPISLTELCINTTLRCGQSFRWRQSDDGEWTCTLHGRILALTQDSEHVHYRAVFPKAAIPSPPSSVTSALASPVEDDTSELVRHYLNIKPNLSQQYELWALSDANFKKKAPKFTGIRILQQDAWEALLGFICSSNNNISRISGMMENLCINYGPFIGTLGSRKYHDLPPPQALVGKDVEQKLRELGFGYRAKYIHQTAKIVHERGLDWLEGLRNPERPLLGQKASSAGEMVEGGREGYRHAHEQLLSLQGVGPKVADCVCLMGLGWGESVPVDTHVWQIAQRDYKFGKGKHSSLTKATYDAVANKFRALWGDEAGWAQSVLFTANLKAFSERLVEKVEVKAEVKVKREGSEEVKTEVVETKAVTKRVKRELDSDQAPLAELETTSRRSKRTRRS